MCRVFCLEGDLYKVIALTDSDPLGCAIYRGGVGCHGCQKGANCHSTGLFHNLNNHVGVCVKLYVYFYVCFPSACFALSEPVHAEFRFACLSMRD